MYVGCSKSFKQGGTLHLSKIEFPSSKDALRQVWLKLAQWFWRRFLNFVNVFSLIRNYLPLEKGVALYWKNLNPHYPKMLCAKFRWNWLSGSGEEDENVKSLRQQRQQRRRLTDKIRKAHLSLWLRWAKNMSFLRNVTDMLVWIHITEQRA